MITESDRKVSNAPFDTIFYSCDPVWHFTLFSAAARCIYIVLNDIIPLKVSFKLHSNKCS